MFDVKSHSLGIKFAIGAANYFCQFVCDVFVNVVNANRAILNSVSDMVELNINMLRLPLDFDNAIAL